MSLAVKATRSAAWMLAGGIASRAVGLVATLLVIRYITPEDYGEAIAGSIVVATASQFSSLGIGQFVIVKARGRRDLAFHATMFQLILGLLAIGILLMMPNQLNVWFNAPGMSRYMPTLAVSMLIDRVSFVPERVLMREMGFRSVALGRASGEIAYSLFSIVTAILGWGGMAIAVANVARSVVRALVMLPLVDRRDWLEPCRLRLDATMDVVRYGGPLSIGAFAAFVAGKWDNLLTSRFFGSAIMAEYNLAYNLAGMAPGLVAEQVIDILVPSMTNTDAKKRPEALVRGSALLGMITVPLCFGLAAVAPTVVATFFVHRWEGVAPMLAILSAVTVVAPVIGMIFAYLQVSDMPRRVMLLQVLAGVSILGSISAIGRLGPLWVCAADGVGAAICFVVALFVASSVDKVPILKLLKTHSGPFFASIPMVGAIFAVRWLMDHAGIHVRFVNLGVELVIGAVSYIVGAFVFAGETTRSMLRLFRDAFLRRRRASLAPEAP